MRQVIVIGGGAAGMIAAYRAARSGAKVTLLEKNEKLGKKIFITGKGRCNVCNAADREGFFRNVVSNPKFLYSAYSKWDNRRMMELLEGAGCALKIERGDRVFPVSDHAYDVTDALKRLMNQYGVHVMLNSAVKELIIEGNAVRGVLLENGRKLAAEACIVCTGGISYPSTGSTGDGYRLAESAGHKLTKPHPALVPLETVEEWPAEVMGLSLKNVGLKMAFGKKTLYESMGEMMFTHFGVTGPLVLSASSFFPDPEKQKSGETVKLLIDLKPALSMEQLELRLQRDFEENRGKQFKNSLGGLFPSSLIPIMVRLSGIDPEKKVTELGRQQKADFCYLIKHVPLQVKGPRGFAEAIITRGGVSVKQVNPSTMESKLVSGLYFAGEVLDLDALTGGFNLQIAWTTGYLAGESAAANKEQEVLYEL